jgi:two-component system LytT family response regulator
MNTAKLRVLIVDDEEPARRRLVELLRAAVPEAVITEAANGQQALVLVQSSPPDLVFLDVQMPELAGMQFLEAVGSEHMPLTIFVTAYDRHAIEAFEANALDYLLKPYSDERFEAALERARNRMDEATLSELGKRVLQATSTETKKKRYLERLAVRVDGGTRLIPSLEVESFEGAGVYVTLHTKGREYLYRGTLSRLSEGLNPETFIRVHRSTIVNIAAIVLLEPTSHGEFEATLRSGRHIQVSRTFRGDLEERLQQDL